ncbi:MAG: hypothetical protein AAFQ71_12745, partial [Planctomycetota bacterium]
LRQTGTAADEPDRFTLARPAHQIEASSVLDAWRRSAGAPQEPADVDPETWDALKRAQRSASDRFTLADLAGSERGASKNPATSEDETHVRTRGPEPA